MTESLKECRDWTEDFILENGNYQNICGSCWHAFNGHKRRITCKACSLAAESEAQTNAGRTERRVSQRRVTPNADNNIDMKRWSNDRRKPSAAPTQPPARRLPEESANMVPDGERGLYRKYEVKRLNDHAGKHKDCEYYVLDLIHDKFAMPALQAYANACESEFPELAKDLRDKWPAPTQPPDSAGSPTPRTDEWYGKRLKGLDNDEPILRSLLEFARQLETELAAPQARIEEAGKALKPAGTLHDDGYFTWNQESVASGQKYAASFAGWKTPFYLEHQVTALLAKSAECDRMRAELANWKSPDSWKDAGLIKTAGEQRNVFDVANSPEQKFDAARGDSREPD